MEERIYRIGRELTQEQDSYFGTFQLSLDELACDIYYEERKDDNDDELIYEFDFRK